MEKRRINMMHMIPVLFLFLAPVFASSFEKTITVYASLGLFSVYLALRIIKSGVIFVTRSAFFLSIAAVYSFLQLLWVSDKGAHVALSVLFLVATMGSLIVAEYKRRMGSEGFKNMMLRLVYAASVFYAVMAILHQVFIESRFFDCSMCFGKGSGATSAFIAVIGLSTAFTLFGKNKKHSAFYIAVPLMLYVIIMAKSVTGYLFLATVAFAWAITHRHKKAEALSALMVTLAVGAVNVINAVAVLFTNPGYFNGAIKGLVSVFGIGCMGYNATAEIVGKGSALSDITFNLFGEAYGVFGFVIMAVMVSSGIRLYKKERSFESLMMLFFTTGVIFTSSATLAFTLPLIGMYYAAGDESVDFSVNKAIALLMAVPVIGGALFTFAHVPYGIGKHQCDLGNFQTGGKYYSLGATMEIFNSKGWEKAYKAYAKGTSRNYQDERELIEKAYRFNKKNYSYYRDMADVYTAEGDYLKALEVWENIIIRHDKEQLYPGYGNKILDVMANCPLGLEKTEELFNRIDTYAKKASDKNIIFEMNNILSKSQQYYVNAREGGSTVGDMYSDTENMPEVEYESSSAEG